MTEQIRLAAGDVPPALRLPDADGREVSLADYRGRRVIVYCYPAAATPGCTKQACDSGTTWPTWKLPGWP